MYGMPDLPTPDDAERDFRVRKLALECEKLEEERDDARNRRDTNKTEDDLRVAKLRLECEKLEYDRSDSQRRWERLKTAATASGILTAAVAIVVAASSVIQTQWNFRQAEEKRAYERLTDGIRQLRSDHESTRLDGIAFLSSLLRSANSEQKLQIIRSLVNNLATEPSPLARTATIAVFDELDITDLASQDRDRALSAIMLTSRRMTPETIDNEESPEEDRGKVGEAAARAKALASVIGILARKGMLSADMSGLYLAGADFHGVTFPSGTRFDHSVVSDANFADAKLERASFRDASLEKTSFVRANLRSADFSRSVREDPWGYLRLPLFPMNTGNTGTDISGVSYECADLTDAMFLGHTIAGISPDNSSFISLTTSFRGARLAGADLRGTEALGAAPKFVESPVLLLRLAKKTPASNIESYYARFNDRPTIATDPAASAACRLYSRSLFELARHFDGTDWQAAKLPPGLRLVFEQYSPEKKAVGGCANVP